MKKLHVQAIFHSIPLKCIAWLVCGTTKFIVGHCFILSRIIHSCCRRLGHSLYTSQSLSYQRAWLVTQTSFILSVNVLYFLFFLFCLMLLLCSFCCNMSWQSMCASEVWFVAIVLSFSLFIVPSASPILSISINITHSICVIQQFKHKTVRGLQTSITESTCQKWGQLLHVHWLSNSCKRNP